VLFGNDYESISEKYDFIIEKWINSERSDEISLSKLEQLKIELELFDDINDKYLWLSKSALVKGMILFFREDKKNSISELKTAQDFAQKSLELSNSSEAWRLLSDAGSFIMLQKSTGYIIANSGKVKEQAEKSIELNRRNARASLIVAQGLLNAPKIFGGDKEKGIRLIEDLIKREDLSYEDRYFIMSALSDAYVALDRDDDAVRNYRMMLSIYPGSMYIQSKFDELR